MARNEFSGMDMLLAALGGGLLGALGMAVFDRSAQGATRPAGQAFTESVGFAARWLSHRGITCGQWTNRTRVQQLTYLRDFLFGNSNLDSFDSSVRQSFLAGFPRDQSLYVRVSFSGTQPIHVPSFASSVEDALSTLLSHLNSDCFRSEILGANSFHPVTIQPMSRWPA